MIKIIQEYYIYLYIYIYIYIYLYYFYIYTILHIHIFQRSILIVHIFCFSEKVKHEKGRKENVGERRFVLYQHICTMYFSSKIHRNLITFFAHQNIIMIIMQKLQPVAFIRNGVLQVLTSWKNETVLQCLKQHRIHMFSDSTREKVLYI